MPTYESIIFDLDGTLVDSAPGIEYALRESIRLILPETVIDLTNIRANIGPPLPDLVRQLLPDTTPEVVNRVATRFRSIYDDFGWQKTRLYETAIETLSRLRDLHIRCFLVTNKRLTPTRQILQGFGLLPFFADIATADSDPRTLQSKESMIRYLISEHLLNPARTLMIGDTRSDATAARICGMDFAVAVYGYGSVHTENEWQGKYTLHKLADLLQIVSGPT